MNVFDKLAKRYDEWYEKPFGKSAYELECLCLKDLIDDPSNSLEVGVGTGRFASRLKIRYGVDPSLGMLNIAKNRNVKVILGRAENLPFKDKTFKTVIFVVTICFLDDPSKALKEAFRVLKEGGTVVLGLVLRDSPWAEFYIKKAKKGHPIYKHARFYSFEEIENLLTVNGFKIERVRSTLMEEPQDEKPVKNKEVLERLNLKAGFTCIKAKKE